MPREKWNNRSGSKTYYSWRNMRRRCSDSNDDAYDNYGGRGISVCDRWLNNYDNFFEDMGACPPNKSLDRIDSNGNYEPQNCRWATIKEQLNNQRRNVIITFNNKTLTLSQWADEAGVAVDTLWRRINTYNMPIEKALSPTSLRKTWKHGTRHGYEKGCRCRECKDAHNARFRAIRAKKKGECACK